jgi:uncharacterized protein YwgA
MKKYKIRGEKMERGEISTFSDAEGLLAFFEAAHNEQFIVEEQYVDSYIYILKEKGLPFSYSFVFQPMPYSKELREDLLGLRMSGYLTEKSIEITDKGMKWVRGRQAVISEFRDLLEKIVEYIKIFRSYYGRKEILDAVYAWIV